MADENHNTDTAEKRMAVDDHRETEEHSPGRNPYWGSEYGRQERIFLCEPQPTTSPLKPEIRECDWSQFKNVLADDPIYAIDILVAGSDLNLQVLDEFVRRHPPGGEYRGATWRHPLFYKKWIPSPHRWIQRIRIRSAAILQALNDITGDTWDTSKAHTFMKPFGYLIFHQEAMKKKLASLELEILEHISNATGEQDSTSDVEEIRCYTDFVDSSLLPLYRQFENDNNNSRKITFDDLWYLFRPGELIVDGSVETNPHFETLRGSDSYVDTMKVIWRVADVRPHEGRIRYDTVYADSSSGTSSDVPGSEEDRDSNTLHVLWFSEPVAPRPIVGWFTLRCYYIDFDGEHYFPVWKKIAIPPFTGERSISSVTVYPLRFAHDSDIVYRNAVLQGERFLDCVGRKHLWHSGWFLMGDPDGTMMVSTKGAPMKETAEYTGEVYVDVKEAMNDRLQWRIFHRACTPYQVSTRTFIEPFPVVTWDTSDRKRDLSSRYEIVVLNDDVHRFQFDKCLPNDRYISEPHGLKAGDPLSLGDDDLALLPRRLYVYILRFHFFIPVDVNNLQHLSSQPKAFEEVIFKKKSLVKDRLNALLDSYFQRKKLIEVASTLATDDFVRGKASGLVILLQGAPGTGKTATVEAIAQSRGKPLIVVNPDDADDDIKLNGIFRVATKWDCIVLWDEVDVLLTRRSTRVQENIFVSKLLRYLETFTGILFLTTMRAGAFDEGVKSRVHLSICYHPLDELQTVEIFKIHLSQLRRSESLQHDACPDFRPVGIWESDILNFAREHYNTNSVQIGRWNGRQIRNAVRVAAAIAHYEYRETPPDIQPQLRADHFRKVAELTKEYDDIRQKTLGITDGGLAISTRERFDIETDRSRADKSVKSTSKSIRTGASRNSSSSALRGAGYRSEDADHRDSNPRNNEDGDDNQNPDEDEDVDDMNREKHKFSHPSVTGRRDAHDPLGENGGDHHRISGFGPDRHDSFGTGSSAGMLKENLWGRKY
ncbi:hypothetical protein QBC37DRAFT_422209 [Rhypophila decipiens]|uniref:AAA+ ATPase domain-containing protein n=1 Tax=Rhypophila decipiens TaxID=261697 RepID=A0AAN7B5X5_9PEZI|nr:hypothetical protein QBC37DRAFT_422209 [Rhypophila decipiens]